MFREHMHQHFGQNTCEDRRAFFGGRGHCGFEGRGGFGAGVEGRGFGRDRREGFGRFGGGGGKHGHFERFFAAGAGGRERFFDGGDLQLVILSLLAEQPSYGYQLIKAIEDRMGGGYAPSPGVVYPTLTLLEERGLAQVEPSEGNRKVYGITEAGRAELEAQRERMAELRARLEQGRERFGRGRSPRIRRAFLELRQAILRSSLRGREAGSGSEAERADKIAEVIEQAARAIDAL